MSIYGDTLEAVLREAERAFNETKSGTRGIPEPFEDVYAAELVQKASTLIRADATAPFVGLGGEDDHAKLWRMIAGIALRQAANREIAIANQIQFKATK